MIAVAIFHGLGDCVNATAVLPFIKARHGKVIWVTCKQYTALVEHNPHVEKVEIIDEKPMACDKHYPRLRKMYGSNLLTPAPYMNPIGPTLAGWFISLTKKYGNNGQYLKPQLFVTPQEVADVDNWLHDRGIKKFVMLEALYGSRQSFWNRQYSVETIKLLTQKGYTVLFTHRTEPNIDEYNKIGRVVCLDVDFRYLPVFYNKSSGFIGVSSGASVLCHTHQCRLDVPHVEFVRGEHWCTRQYAPKKNKVISFNTAMASVRQNINRTIPRCT